MLNGLLQDEIGPAATGLSLFFGMFAAGLLPFILLLFRWIAAYGRKYVEVSFGAGYVFLLWMMCLLPNMQIKLVSLLGLVLGVVTGLILRSVYRQRRRTRSQTAVGE